MEEELRPTRSSSSAPSVDALDAALERMEAARSATGQSIGQATGLDVDEDDTTGTDATAGSQPDDDDFLDDDDTDEVNTPARTAAQESDTSTEARQSKKPATSTPEEQDQGTNTDDDTPLSRKQRGKLISELRLELEKEQAAKKHLEDSLASQKEADERLNQEVDRALGTQADFDKAIEDGLAGDERAGERARIWKANREFYKKLVDKSQRDSSAGFMNQYWQEVQGLPGVTQESLQAPSLSGILKNLYDAGVASVKDSSNSEVDKLKEEISTWRGRYKKLKLAAGGSKTSPLGGGGGSTAVTDTSFDWRKHYIDAKGMLTDQAEAIVSQYGFEALKDPKHYKAR